MSTTTDGGAEKMADRVPAEVFPPGEFLRDELEARGWSQVEFAEIIGRPPRLINEILAGKRSISPATAREIGAALGTSAIFWLNLEAAYQLYRAPEPVPARIAKEAKIRGKFPVREMIRRGWIEGSDSADVLETRLLQFYRIPTLDTTPEFAHAARKTDYEEQPNPVQTAWLFRVRQIAETLAVTAYSETKLRASLDMLKELRSEPEGVRHIPRILSEAGVRFVIVEPMPGSKIDGVCFWLDTGTKPVIGLSMRFDRIDNLWFVLRHEVEHVLCGHGKDYPIIDSDLGNGASEVGAPPEEIVANKAAGEFCVSAVEMDDFVGRVHMMNWETRVVGFAHRIGVHPGIVAGQLRRRTGRYDFLARYLVKVRHLIVPNAISDGYGQAFTLSK